MIEQHSGTEDYENRWKFNGKELDTETGLYYYGARYYDPSVSIWMSVDPLAEKFPAWNPYNYTMQNPINLIDPDGMAPFDWYKSKDGQYLWRSGKTSSVSLATSVNNNKPTGFKTFEWVGGDDLKIDSMGANVVAIGGGVTDKWAYDFQRDAIDLQNSSESRTVIILSGGSSNGKGDKGALAGLKATTKAFGAINDVALRNHSDFRGGVSSLLIQNKSGSLNGFTTLKNYVDNGSICLSGTSFYFLACGANSYANDFTLETGITSYGVKRARGIDTFSAPYNSFGTYYSGKGASYYENSRIWDASEGRYKSRTSRSSNRIKVFDNQ